MSDVISLKKAQEDRAEAYRQRLLECYANTELPVEHYPNAEFQKPAITRESHDTLLRIFNLFGVTELDPSDDDYDRVAGTWFVLTGVVGRHLSSRHKYKALVFDVEYPTWSKAYQCYINALWDGNPQAIKNAAKALGIERGVKHMDVRFHQD